MVGMLMIMLFAGVPGDDLDHALEAKARELEVQVIAPCCWRAPVSEHYSGAADDMRHQIRDMLSKGMSDEQVLQSFINQYGARILSAPPATGFNLLSWVLPFVALALGGLGILVFLRSNSRPLPAEAPQPSAPQKQSGDDRYAKMLEEELREV